MIRWLMLAFTFAAFNSHADTVQYLARPEQSLAAFDTAIAGAKKSIDIATFIFEPCHPSVRALTAKLIARARAGVKVRVLLDAFQQSYDQQQALANEFAAYGIELRFYSSSLIDIDLRMHAKFTVIDGTTVIAGGRNLADQYFAMSEELEYIDSDFIAVGMTATQAQAGFNQVWASDMVTPANDPTDSATDWNDFCGEDLTPATNTVEAYLKKNETSLMSSIPVRTCAASFTVDNPDYYKANYGPSWDNGNGAEAFMTKSRLSLKTATTAVLNFINGSAKTLTVENYEYIPITQLEKAFRSARKRKVAISVLTNQDIEAEGPDFYVKAQEYELQKRQAKDNRGTETVTLVASSGALTSAYQLTPKGPPTFIHSKVMTRDGQDVLIGSFNTDARSANINVETATLFSECPGLVSDLAAGAASIQAAYETDIHSANPPAVPDPNPLEQFLGDMFLSQF